MNETTDNDAASMAEQVSRLKELEKEAEQLRKALEEARPRLQAAYAEAIKAHCEEQGWRVEDIVARLHTKPAARKTVTRRWKHKEKPNLVYSGRGLPHWMRDDMQDRGYDPTRRVERERYRSEMLEEIAA